MLLAARGIILTYETIRQWCLKFGQPFAKEIRHRQGGPGGTWFMDEISVTINGVRHYLWRAVDQDNNVIDILVQKRRDKGTTKRFFRKILKRQGQSPRRMVTDKLESYGAAQKEVIPSVVHCQDRYANNRAEASHQQTRQRERQVQRFKSPGQAQCFLAIHSQVYNLFRVGRHLLKAGHYRMFRARAFSTWQEVTCA